MVSTKYASNYSIENIAQSIVRDNPIGKKYTAARKKKRYRECCLLLEKFPDIKKLLLPENIRKLAPPWTKRIARVGILPPEIIVVDSRIQDMCSLPFWTYYGAVEGSFGRCAGVGAFSCCPPFTPKADKVRALLDRSNLFVVIQTKPGEMTGGGNPGAQFRGINRLKDKIDSAAGKGTVVQKFGGGPCFACFPESCEGGGACNAPSLKVPSLEGMGICVDQICKDLALLTGDPSWIITWIRGFGTPDQKPKRFKGVAGLSLRLTP